MSGSYPSPMSSDASPVPVSSMITTSVHEQHTETQRNLHQASVALEAAYDRIRQVRRSLLQLSDTLPAPNPQAQASTFDRHQVGPSHEAIVLTGSGGGDPGAEDGQSSPASFAFFPPPHPSPQQARQTPHRPRNLATEDMRSLDLTTPDLSTTRRTLPPHSNPISQSVHPSGSPSRSLPRRSFSDALQSQRLGVRRDDPSTALGRRVAAREASGTLGISSPFLSHGDSGPVDPGPLQYFGRFQRPDSGRLDPLIEDREREDILSRTYESRRLAQAPPVSWRFQEARRLQGPRSDVRQLTRSTLSDHSERLSLLSNFPAQNLTTPLTADFSRPLLFDEPSSYAPTREDISEELPFGRNYVIHRRLGPDGEERVHNINLEWDEDDLPSWLLSQGQNQEDFPVFAAPPPRMNPSSRNNGHSSHDSAIHVTRTTNTLVSPPEILARRRGWARLDPDGNEIPSDEEEELERSRTEYRIRALYQARVSGQAARSTNNQASYSVTDSVRSPYNTNFGLSRSNYRTPEFSYETPPFLVDSLPMSLSEMIPSSKGSNGDDHVIIVPKHASLAGR